MALSNWDTLAFDTAGEAGSGVLKDAFGKPSFLEIYKNWLYVMDETDKADIESPGRFVAEIQEGSVTVLSFRIIAARGKQEGVYVYAETGYSYSKDQPFECMSGIGCYGYDYDRWVGVEEETLDDFFLFLEANAPKKYFDKVVEADRVRFNQGDAYFAKHLGTDLQASKPGKAKDPVITEFLK
jgi:hypothetical protein